jgi:hypothetical protein
MLGKFVAAAVGAALVTPAIANARLAGQEIRGTERICVYRGSLNEPRGGSTTIATRSLTIGLGEPCPPFARRPAATSSRPPVTSVLRSQQRVGDRRACTYSQAGQDYVLMIPSASTCTLTPN